MNDSTRAPTPPSMQPRPSSHGAQNNPRNTGIADLEKAEQDSLTTSIESIETRSGVLPHLAGIRGGDAEKGDGGDTEQEVVVESGGAGDGLEKDGTVAPSSVHGPRSLRSASHVGSIPDGGLVAWLQVLGSFFLFFNSWGVVNTFGSYQTYYERDLLRHSSPSAISWIGSIQAMLLMFVGAVAGPIYDAGYFRELLIGGSVLLVLGQMMLSLCKEYWQVLLSQAFCIGIGCGALFVPSVAILSTYFTTKLATAVGLAAAGSSLGGVVYPIIFRQLLPKIGFGWATRVIGFIILGTMLIPNLCMRLRVLPQNRRALLHLAAFKEPAYSFNVVGFFLGFVGLYMPFFYSQVYAIEKGLMSESMAFYLLSIMNSTSTFGRIIPNWLADKIGPFNVAIPCTFASAILAFGFIGVDSSASIIVVIALYGFFSGAFVSLPPTILVHLSLNDRPKMGARMGQAFAITSIGMLIGTPIGGAIRDASGFTAVWVYGGAMIMAGTLALVASRGFHRGWGLMVKA